jgi:hypothetical protein
MHLFDLISKKTTATRSFWQASILVGLLLALLSPVYAQGAKSIFYRQLDDRTQVNNVGLTYSIELIRNGKRALVDSRYPFASGDQLRFHVQSNIDGYLYIVMQRGSRGDAALLFPAAPENNHIAAGKDIRVPEKGVLEFDEVAGVEKVKLVLSADRIEGNPAAYQRSIVITPKPAIDRATTQCLIDFAQKDGKKATFKTAEIMPQFANEPAVTVVSLDSRRTLCLEMDLFHGSGKDTIAQSRAAGAKQELAPPSGPLAAGAAKPPDGTAVSSAAALPFRGAADGSASPRPVRDKWAVIVGISEFKNPKWNLLYPAKDAQDLSRFLIDEAHFAPDHVKVLTNASATRENILTTLGSDWLPSNAGPDDMVFVYFASHGTSAEQDIARKSFLIAYDTDPRNAFATGIELQDLSRTIKRRINSDRIIIVLDACHSGAAEPGAKALFPPQSFRFEDLLQGNGQLVIASAAENQIAHDSLRYKNGIFTKHFIDGLRNNRKLEDAFAYTRTKVEEECNHDFHDLQSPVLKNNEWKGSDVILAVPPASPSRAKP